MGQTGHFDDLETRSADARAADHLDALRTQVDRARALPGYEHLGDVSVESNQ